VTHPTTRDTTAIRADERPPTGADDAVHECRGCGGLTRRAVLAGVGALGAAVTLAACGGAGSSTGSDGGPATPGSTSGTDGSPAAPGALAKVADVPVGGAIAARLDGAPVIVTQPSAGQFVGLSAICTHEGCTVAPDGDHLACPCHRSMFDLAGAVTQGPATEPLATFALSVDGEDIVVGQA